MKRRKYIRGGILTDGQRAYLSGQHILCQDLDKIEDKNERKKLKARKRQMRHRIKTAIEQAKFDLTLLEGFEFDEELEKTLNRLWIKTSSPLEAIKKVFKRGRGIIRTPVEFTCMFCGKKQLQKIDYDSKTGKVIARTASYGIDRKEVKK